ncbi:glycosyltransferase family 4 protein [Luteolibacter yonseiensis]|uniref:Glycosyltransferase family 4 protein n=1 Tax=Luteolibacter yonseiensis TaxID=1144680 RepID=A0A934VDV7_9BACT|nr:glycosyltransferase family 4 protein [Luteolibacter yonseiensis]MBK1817959.1 glycosyltransferase family 4 protein [Luteolibacter yonseiensis]
MKILVISNLYPPHEIGGYEIICRDVVEQLTKTGHELRVLTSDHRIANRPEFAQPHVSRRLKIHGFFGHPWLPIHRLFKEIEAPNHRAVREEIAAFRPDVVYVWNLGGISKSILHTLRASAIPVTFFVSDHWIARSLAADVWLGWWNTPGTFSRTFLRGILTALGIRKRLDLAAPTAPTSTLRFENISFCSAFLRDLTAAKGWPVAHAEVIHTATETSVFTVKTDHSRFEKLLWVGRLSADKDPLTAIRAVAAAHRAGMTFLTLDIFGNGDAPYLAEIDEEIRKLGLTDHIHRRTALASEMRGLYSQYDALLFTSNWGEPFAITPLEAMASGLPVITSLDGGQVELARHGVNCLVAEAANPDLYATSLAELGASPELRASISTTGLEEVRNRLDIAPITRQIEALLLKARNA